MSILHHARKLVAGCLFSHDGLSGVFDGPDEKHTEYLL